MSGNLSSFLNGRETDLRVTAVHFIPQHSIPNSTLAAPSKLGPRQYGAVQDYVFVQHHVAAALPMIPKDFPGQIIIPSDT